MIRYLIVAQHDGLKDTDFEFYTNSKRMTGWMGDLRQKQYRPVRLDPKISAQEKSKLLKNEVELLCYQIIASAAVLIELQKLLSDIGDLDQDYDPASKALLQESIKIASAI